MSMDGCEVEGCVMRECLCVFWGRGGSDNDDGCDEIDGDHSSQRNRQPERRDANSRGGKRMGLTNGSGLGNTYIYHSYRRYCM
jgi:hypothetical protein